MEAESRGREKGSEKRSVLVDSFAWSTTIRCKGAHGAIALCALLGAHQPLGRNLFRSTCSTSAERLGGWTNRNPVIASRFHGQENKEDGKQLPHTHLLFEGFGFPSREDMGGAA